MSAEIVNPNETARADAFELWMQVLEFKLLPVGKDLVKYYPFGGNVEE